MTCEKFGCTREAVTAFSVRIHRSAFALNTTPSESCTLRVTNLCGDHGRELITQENNSCHFVSMSPLF